VGLLLAVHFSALKSSLSLFFDFSILKKRPCFKDSALADTIIKRRKKFLLFIFSKVWQIPVLHDGRGRRTTHVDKFDQ
jgi:hypothetical protein